MKGIFHRFALIALVGLVSLAVSSCGGGSSNATDDAEPAAQRSGTIGILLTDKPADPALFASINASIESVELLGSHAGGRVILYSGPARTYDLLRLRNEAVPFSFSDDVPAGTYCKIRLILSDLELVLADDTPNDDSDNPTYHPHLPGNGKLDLVVQGCFEVGGGRVLTIMVDIDAGNSIHIVGNNKGFNFRPVILAQVLRQDFRAKLVRLEGKIAAVDSRRSKLLLCGAIPTRHMDSKGCVVVHLGEDAAFFDNHEYAGAARALSELLADEKVGRQLTVIGWPHYRVKPYHDIEVSQRHYPPPGECRLWDIDLEPGRQAPPIDCDDLPAGLPPDTIVVTHDGPRENRYHPLMALDGLVVELGDFLTLEGMAATDADDTGFDMSVSRGGPIISSDTLRVTLQPGWPGVNGTRVVSRAGVLLEAQDIDAPLPVQVDGVLELITGSDPLLTAALVIVDAEAIGKEQVTGRVVSVGANMLWLDPDADTVCGVAADQLRVELATDLDILTVTIDDDGSRIQSGGRLAQGQEIGMNGSCAVDGYRTDNLVIVEDLRA